MKHSDIFMLHNRLNTAHVPNEFVNRSHDGQELYQIYYPSADAWICSVLQGDEIPGEGVEMFWRQVIGNRWPVNDAPDRIERHTAADAFNHIYLSYVKWGRA